MILQLLAEKENPVAIVPETDPLTVQEEVVTNDVEKKKGKKQGVAKKDLKKKEQVQVDPNIAKGLLIICMRLVVEAKHNV